ncbi:MAG: DUF5329 domain-containing protein [Deltaproteobacteria bacterium]|nr:DUF5329 domain-containing protein [Deltaproteobacteria bacterium]
MILAALGPVALAGQALASTEKQKIEMLIKLIGDLQDANFVRNGSSYSASNAATFLRRKWQANNSKVKTARDFIERVASFSGTSGKPYLIRFKNGKETKSREFLITALREIEQTPGERQPGSEG